MKKGFYFISTREHDKDGKPFQAPSLCEGSYENYGRLFIHRAIDNERKKNQWKVSHVESGAAIVWEVSLKTARSLVKKFQGFRLWELKTFNELSDAINLHHLGYQEEVERIKQIRMERA